MELPLKAVSPANFFTGSDSPVSAAWSHCTPAVRKARSVMACQHAVTRCATGHHGEAVASQQAEPRAAALQFCDTKYADDLQDNGALGLL